MEILTLNTKFCVKCVSYDKIQPPKITKKVAKYKNDIRISESQDFGGF